jgi:hypothetical protein
MSVSFDTFSPLVVVMRALCASAPAKSSDISRHNDHEISRIIAIEIVREPA